VHGIARQSGGFVNIRSEIGEATSISSCRARSKQIPRTSRRNPLTCPTVQYCACGWRQGLDVDQYQAGTSLHFKLVTYTAAKEWMQAPHPSSEREPRKRVLISATSLPHLKKAT